MITFVKKVQHGALINYVLSERGQGSPTRGARLQTVAKKTPAAGKSLVESHLQPWHQH